MNSFNSSLHNLSEDLHFLFDSSSQDSALKSDRVADIDGQLSFNSQQLGQSRSKVKA